MKRFTQALLFFWIDSMNLRPLPTTKHNQLLGLNQPPPVVPSPIPLQAILENGSEEELAAALGQLPEGLCDLREVTLTESMASKLASAVQQVHVTTLILGVMDWPEPLLEVIVHSRVRQWDFSCAEIRFPKYFRCAFPLERHVQYLAEEVLPRLHSCSCTQEIVLKQIVLDHTELELLKPFRVNGDSSTGLCHLVCEERKGDAQATVAVQVQDTRVSLPSTTSAAPQTLCPQTPGQRQQPTSLPTFSAYVEASTNAEGDSRVPTVQPRPQGASMIEREHAKLRHQDNIINRNLEAIRQAFLDADQGCVDLRGIRVALGAEVQALVTALETTSIDSLALGFVNEQVFVLKSLTRSNVTKVNLYFLSNHVEQNTSDYKLSDEIFQCILDYLDAVSTTQPRRELMLNPDQLTDLQCQKLTARFSAVPTSVKEREHELRDGITFISQVSAPRHEPSSQADREPQVPPRHELPPVVAPSQLATPAKPEGASNFVSIAGVLGKHISSGRSTQVKSQLGRADAPFNAQQLRVLKAIAQKYVNDDAENVKQAAQVVLDLQ